MKELNVEFGSIDSNNIEQLRKLNDAIFPISYGPKFYDQVLAQPATLTKYTYYNGFVIGAICTRLEDHPEEVGKKRAYVMTLGVLSSYRGRGVGEKMVQSVVNELSGKGEGAEEEYANVVDIYVHTQVSNVDAINFYCKNFEFEKGEVIKDYYKRIDPPDAILLRKTLRE